MNGPKLNDEHIDRLARVMAAPINGAQIERVASRTNTKKYDEKAGWSKEDRLVAYLDNVNRADEIDEVLAMLIDKLDIYSRTEVLIDSWWTDGFECRPDC